MEARRTPLSPLLVLLGELGLEPRLATVASLGNHDFGVAWRQMDVAERVGEVLRGAGITVLRNEVIDVRGLQIAGLGDYWTPDFGPPRPIGSLLSAPPSEPGAPAVREAADVLGRIERARATIVLCHNPDAADEPIWGDLEGWILAGPRTAGDASRPFLPPPCCQCEIGDIPRSDSVGGVEPCTSTEDWVT